MAAADVAPRTPPERPPRRKPFTQWMKSLANLKNKGSDQRDKSNGKPPGKTYTKKTGTLRTNKDGTLKHNPYPESGAHLHLGQSPVSSRNGPLSIATATSRPQHSQGSQESLEPRRSNGIDREAQSASNKSGAPTLATNPETVHSDAGNSKAATVATHGGALSDTIGHDSTFSSPSQSQHSLTTTLTTIQSTSAGTVLGGASATNTTSTHHGSLNNPNPVMFSHQYPVSPAPSSGTAISAIPRHMTEQPNTYDRATANGLLTDNASILTLASSSKRRRRSVESQTDASVRALAPSSVWGGSRESLPLSVLSGNNADRDRDRGGDLPRRSIGGLASAERASVYSSSGVTAPALASERNSYYSYSHSHKQPNSTAGTVKGGVGGGADPSDAKSLRSITNIDARSQYDTRSINTDARSLVDVASLKNYEGSVRSGALGHSRQDSNPGSNNSPVTPSPGGLIRQFSTGTGTGIGVGAGAGAGNGGMSRRSSDWQQDVDKSIDGDGAHGDGPGDDEEKENHAVVNDRGD